MPKPKMFQSTPARGGRLPAGRKRTRQGNGVSIHARARRATGSAGGALNHTINCVSIHARARRATVSSRDSRALAACFLGFNPRPRAAGDSVRFKPMANTGYLEHPSANRRWPMECLGQKVLCRYPLTLTTKELKNARRFARTALGPTCNRFRFALTFIESRVLRDHRLDLAPTCSTRCLQFEPKK